MYNYRLTPFFYPKGKRKMKQSYNIEIAGVQLNIVTEDGAEFVEKTVAEFESSVQSVLRVGKNYSKLDAILLSALDYCGEFRKAEDKIRNLEAQIEILEARVRRDGGEVPAPAAEPVKAEPAAEEAPAEEPVAEEVAETTPAEETPAEKESSRDESFRQLEAFLGSQISLDLGNE